MLKSSNKLFLLFALTTISFLGCNHEKSDTKDLKNEGEKTAKSVLVDSIAPKTNPAPFSFDIQIEGYKASELGEAIHSGSVEKIKALIQSGAPIDKCLTDETYVYDALYAAIVFNKKEIVEYLVQNKLYTDINKTYSEEAETPLTLACAIQNKLDALQISQLMITNGANVNGAGESGGEDTKTPIFIAVNQNNIELVQVLLEKGAKKDISNSSGASPLTAAEEKGFSEIANVLK